jgi:hypothetical protein
VSFQYPLLRSSPFLRPDPSGALRKTSGFPLLCVAEGVKGSEVEFGELGYAREARASYQDFLAARSRGELAPGTRFQVSLPTPMAVILPFCMTSDIAAIEPAYEKAMLAEVARICNAIPHRDLAIQWDVCIEMVIWDGRWRGGPPFPGMDKVFADGLARLAAAVPPDVELGFHLCYGDLDARHFIEPEDAGKMVELANLIAANVERPLAWLHMPVPIARHDDAFFAPLRDLRLAADTELYLGLVHAADGVPGTLRRLATARKFAGARTLGIAAECGIARARTPAEVRNILEVHAAVAAS